MKYLIYLFAGYTIVWLVLFLYLIILNNKVGKLAEDINKIYKTFE
ncbi:MAG: CcmD family protein [Acidobacteriota bacterium]